MAVLVIATQRPSLPFFKRGRTAQPQSADTDNAPRAASDLEAYTDRFLKLIPSEAISAYLIGRPIAEQNSLSDFWALAVLALTIVLRYFLTRDEGKADWTLVGLSAVAFFLYVPMMDGAFPFVTLPGWFASLVMVLFVPLMPFILPDRPQMAQRKKAVAQ